MTRTSAPDRPYIPSDLMVRAAREYGKSHGYRGNGGGWISHESSTSRGATVTQGWASFGSMYFRQIADHYTARLTAFGTFGALLDTDERYCPTIIPRTWREQFLADAFDRAMYDRKSPRRAWRGSEVSA